MSLSICALSATHRHFPFHLPIPIAAPTIGGTKYSQRGVKPAFGHAGGPKRGQRNNKAEDVPGPK